MAGAAKQAVAQTLGEAPGFFIGLGKLNRAVSVATEATLLAKGLPKVWAGIAAMAAGGLAEGTVVGTAQSLVTPGQTLAEGGIAGGGLGGGLSGLAGAAEPVVKAVAKGGKALSQTKPIAYIGTLAKDTINALADELTFIPDTGLTDKMFAKGMKELKGARATEAKFAQAEAPSFAQKVARVEDLKPSFVTIVEKADGKLAARVVEIRTDGANKWTDVDINDVGSATKLGDLAKAHDVAVHVSDAAKVKLGDLDPVTYLRAFAGSKTPGGQLQKFSPKRQFAGPTEDTVAPLSAEEKTKFENPHERGLPPLPGGDNPFKPRSGGYTRPIEAGNRLPYPGKPTGENSLTRADPSPWSDQPIKLMDPDAVPDPDLDSAIVTNDNGHVKISPEEPKTQPSTQLDTFIQQGKPPVGGGSGPEPVKINDVVPEEVSYGPPPVPGQLMPAEIENLNTVKKLVNQFKDKFAEYISGDHLRGPRDLADRINILGSTKNLENADPIYQSLRKQFKGYNDASVFARDLDKYAEGKIPVETLPGELPKGRVLSREQANAFMAKKYGDLWLQGKAKVDKLLQESDALHNRLVELGVLKKDLQELAEDGTLQRYQARLYRSYTMKPGEWAKKVEQSYPALIEDARDLLKKSAAAHGEEITDDQISDEIAQMMQTKEAVKSAGGTGRSKAWKRLTQRGDIPEVFRKLMGEETSGFQRLATTLGTQRALVANHEAWASIAQNPIYWSPVKNPALGLTEKVPGINAMYGKAAGGYTKPEFQAFTQMAKATQPDALSRMYQSLIGWTKSSQVAGGGFTPFVNATMGNVYYGVIAGGINPMLRPVKAGQRFREAITLMRDYAKDPSTLSKAGAKIDQMVKLGIDIPGMGEIELGSGRSNMARELEKALREIPENASIHDYFNHYRKNVFGAVGNVKDKFAGAYGSIDRVFKIANFLELEEKFFGKLTGATDMLDPAHGFAPMSHGPELDEIRASLQGAPEMAVREAAARQAARRINMSFPNPQKVG